MTLPTRSILPLLAVPVSLASADFTNAPQARSMVVSRDGIVATAQPLASQAGAMILAQGGTAIDAAIAANAVLGVVEPMSCGIGGDLFAIVYEAKSGKLFGINASGWAPASLTIDRLKGEGIASMPKEGIHSVTIPGAVDGWDKLRSRFGRKSFADLLAPAIHYAEQGFPVTERISRGWIEDEKLLRKDPNADKTFLPEGRGPGVGEVFRNPDLAGVYRRIAESGRGGFYEGDVAKRMVEYANRMGGEWTAGDLKEFSAEWVEPISTTYRGWTVYELPPNGQGIAALMMLNLMEPFDLGSLGHNSPATLHRMIEAKKLAYADMLRWVADPKFSKTPVGKLLSKEYASQRAKRIHRTRANPRVAPGLTVEAGSDTTYLCAVDSEGNMVSWIQSNYFSFGSGLVPDRCGFALQNRGGLFSLDPSHPNALQGRKRPLHTIIPGFMERDETRVAFGIMGGWNQSQAHAQFVSNLIDHRMNIQAAMEAPRFTKISFNGNDVEMEDRIPASVRSRLQMRGHRIKVLHGYSSGVGGGQAVLRDFKNGVNFGASDPRKDGAAVPEPGHAKPGAGR